MKKNILSLLLIFFFAAVATDAQDTTGLAIRQSKFERLMKKKNAVVLDVRLADEYQSGLIGNAVNYNVLDSLRFISQVAPLDKKKKYLLYCKSGRRSGKALTMMKQMGFKKIYHLKGGVTEWKGELYKPE